MTKVLSFTCFNGSADNFIIYIYPFTSPEQVGQGVLCTQEATGSTRLSTSKENPLMKTWTSLKTHGTKLNTSDQLQHSGVTLSI